MKDLHVWCRRRGAGASKPPRLRRTPEKTWQRGSSPGMAHHMYIFIHKHTCILLYVYDHTCIYMHDHIYTFICIYVCLYIYIHIYVYMYLYIEATEAEEDAREDLAERKLTWYGTLYFQSVDIRTYMHIYMYIYLCTYMII